MKKYLLLLAFFIPTQVFADSGMIHVESRYDVEATAEKLVTALNSKGMTVFSQINHSEAAQNVDIELRNTTLVIFGNPKVGSPLMQCAQTAAIDLPQKALIFEDEEGTVWLSYNDVDYIKQRHGIENCDAVLDKIKGALANFANAATQ